MEDLNQFFIMWERENISSQFTPLKNVSPDIFSPGLGRKKHFLTLGEFIAPCYLLSLYFSGSGYSVVFWFHNFLSPDLNRHFSKEATDGQKTYDKMLNITNYQRNSN